MISQDSHVCQDDSVDGFESLVLTPEDSIAIAEIVTTMPPLNVPVSPYNSSSTKKTVKKQKERIEKNKKTNCNPLRMVHRGQ